MQEILAKIDSELSNSQVFNELKTLMEAFNENPSTSPSSLQVSQLQTLNSQFIQEITRLILNEGDSNVFNLLLESTNRLSELNTKSPDTDKTTFDSQQNYNSAEKSEDIINRIAEQLMIETPTTENILVKTISEKLDDCTKLQNDLITTFNLPKNTHTEYIVTALQAQLDRSFDNAENTQDDKLVSELASVKNELNLAKEQITTLENEIKRQNQTFEQPSTTETANVISDLNSELVNQQIDHAKLKSEYATLQSKYSYLQEQFDIISSKNYELKQQNEGLNKQLEDNNLDSEKQKPYERIDEFDKISEEFEKQAEDLSNAKNINLQLISLIEQSTQLNLYYEAQFATKEEQIAQLSKSNNDLAIRVAKANEQIQSNVSDDPDEEKVDDSVIQAVVSILEQIANSEIKNSTIGICNNDNLTISKRLLSVITTLSNSIYQNDIYGDTDDTNDHTTLLLNTIGSLYKFINSIVESQEVQQWVLSKYTFDDACKLMSEEVKKISAFIKSKCIEIRTDESNIFNSFINHHDPYELDDSLRQFLSKYDNVNTKEGKVLLVLLQQSLAAGMLLETYASHATMQCNAQGKELSRTRTQLQEIKQTKQSDIQSLQEELTATRRELLKMQNSSIHKKINENNPTPLFSTGMGPTEEESLFSPERKSQDQQTIQTKNSKSDMKLNDIVDSTDEINDKQAEPSLLNDDQYVTDLQNRLDSTRNDLVTAEQKLDKYRKTVRSVKYALRKEFLNGNQSSALLQSFNTICDADNDKNQNVENEIQEELKLQSTLREKERDIERLTLTLQEAKKTKKKDDQLLKGFENQVGDLQKQMESCIRSYENKMRQLNQENDELKSIVSRMKEQATSKFNDLQENLRKEIVLRKKCQIALKKQRKQLDEIQEARQQESEAFMTETKKREADIQTNQSLKSENEELKQKLKMLQIENKMNLVKLQAKEDQIKREKAISESQWKIQQVGLQTNTKTVLDACNRNNESKSNEFLLSVCRLFRDFVDFEKTLTYETVFQSLIEVSKKLKIFSEKSTQFDQIQSHLTEKTDQDISTLICEEIKQNTILRHKVDQLEPENAELKKLLKSKDQALISRSTSKDWENWAIPFYTKLVQLSQKDSIKLPEPKTTPNSYVIRSVLGSALRDQLASQGETMAQKKLQQRDMLHLSVIVLAMIRMKKLAALRNKAIDPATMKYQV